MTTPEPEIGSLAWTAGKLQQVAADGANTTARIPAVCGDTDGISVCTEPPGHTQPPDPTPHWDKTTQHEWEDED